MAPSTESTATMSQLDAIRHYRPARSLSSTNSTVELRERCVMYLEEGLYLQALTLLSGLLTAGQGLCTNIPSIVPSPAILAIIATLAVHPKSTTRTESHDNIIASNQALSYLRHVLKIVGPINAQLVDAFKFTDARLRKGNNNRMLFGTGEGGASLESAEEEEDFMEVSFAHSESLWALADDFWHTVGWGFSCSVKHKSRWQRWKLYLELMLDAVEADFDERIQKTQREGQDEWHKAKVLSESLAMQYLAKARGQERRARWRIIRAIFATGTMEDEGQFRRIFDRETNPLRKKEPRIPPPRKKLNLEDDDFGDYFDDVDESSDEKENVVRIKEEPGLQSSTRGSRSAARAPSDNAMNGQEDQASKSNDPIEAYGGAEALALRRRCILLLMRVASTLPKEFTSPDEICDLIAETLKPLPLPVFTYFVTNTAALPWPALCHSALLKFLLEPLLAKKAPSHINQEYLERHYLPSAASNATTTTNAQVSIVLEALLRLLRDHDELQASEGLMQATKAGIEARSSKSRKHEQHTPEEAGAEKCLATSSARLDMFLALQLFGGRR